MPKKNAKKGSQNSQGNQYELLDGLHHAEDVIIDEPAVVAAAAKSSRGRALKRTRPIESNSFPPAKRANSTSSTASIHPPPPPLASRAPRAQPLTTPTTPSSSTPHLQLRFRKPEDIADITERPNSL